jgi:SAM-dependent methyltransferase
MPPTLLRVWGGLLVGRLGAACARVWSRLRWPLPAVLAWAAAWAVWSAASALALPAAAAFLLALATGAALAWPCATAWRRTLAAGGFPLSAWALGAAAALPPWAWLLLLLPVLAAYPVRAWRDAPFFPTPASALAGLDAVVGCPQRVLDAGCGLGHGLQALRRLWPEAGLQGLEWSAPLSWAAAWRCRRDRVQIQRGDMWAASWAGHDLVYVFQRPESMARVFDKARRELAPAAWLVSLEFAVPGQAPWACVEGPGRRPLWIYRPAGAVPPDSIQGSQGR